MGPKNWVLDKENSIWIIKIRPEIKKLQQL